MNATTRMCPQCSGALESYRLPTVTVERCEKCTGVWFDPGEFVQYRRYVELGLMGRSGAYLGFRPDESVEPLRCPKCEQNTLQWGEIQSGYALAQCDRCGGHWVAQAVVEEMQRRADAQYMQEPEAQARKWELLRLLLRFLIRRVG